MSSTDPSFAVLLSRAKCGDPSATQQLFDCVARDQREGAALVAMARRLLPPTDRAREFVESQDLIQSALRSGMLDLDDFQGSTSAQFLRWIQTILHHKLHRALRRKRPRLGENLAERCDPAWSEGASPLGMAVRDEVRARVRAAIGALPSDQRAVLDLRLKGLNAPMIAHELGLTPAAVRKRESRAGQRLRLALREYGTGGSCPLPA